MPVHVRVLVWSTCWKFKAPAHRQAMLITPQYAQKGGGAKGQQTKWCPNPELGGFSGRAWPAAIARRVPVPLLLLLPCRLANCHGHDHYWLAKNRRMAQMQTMAQSLLLLPSRAKCRHIKTPHKADKRAWVMLTKSR